MLVGFRVSSDLPTAKARLLTTHPVNDMNITRIRDGKEAKKDPTFKVAGLSEARYAFQPQVHVKR
jgi:hypothetical protein